MKRYTEEIKGKYSVNANDVEMYISENVATGETRILGKAVDALAAYEIAEEQGRLVKDVIRCEKCAQSEQDRTVGLYCHQFKQYRNADDYCSWGKLVEPNA